MGRKPVIDKDLYDLVTEYSQTHNKKECSNHFGISMSSVGNILNHSSFEEMRRKINNSARERFEQRKAMREEAKESSTNTPCPQLPSNVIITPPPTAPTTTPPPADETALLDKYKTVCNNLLAAKVNYDKLKTAYDKLMVDYNELRNSTQNITHTCEKNECCGCEKTLKQGSVVIELGGIKITVSEQ